MLLIIKQHCFNASRLLGRIVRCVKATGCNYFSSETWLPSAFAMHTNTHVDQWIQRGYWSNVWPPSTVRRWPNNIPKLFHRLKFAVRVQQLCRQSSITRNVAWTVQSPQAITVCSKHDKSFPVSLASGRFIYYSQWTGHYNLGFSAEDGSASHGCSHSVVPPCSLQQCYASRGRRLSLRPREA